MNDVHCNDVQSDKPEIVHSPPAVSKPSPQVHQQQQSGAKAKINVQHTTDGKQNAAAVHGKPFSSVRVSQDVKL